MGKYHVIELEAQSVSHAIHLFDQWEKSMRHQRDISIALSALSFFGFPIAFHAIVASASAHKLQIVIFTFVPWAISTIIGIRQAFAISAAGPTSNLGAVFQFSLLVAGAMVAASSQLV